MSASNIARPAAPAGLQRPAMYELIATDLDGTLLNANHQLDPFTVATVGALAARGVPIVIATGRHHRDVAGICDRLRIRPYLITSNGARVHAPDDTLLDALNVPAQTVQQIVQPEIVGEHGRVIVSLFCDDAWLIDRDAPHLLALHRDSGFGYRVTDIRAHHGDGIAKVLYIGDPADLADVAAKLAQRFGASLSVTYSLPNCLEVMAAGVSKGRALRVVLARLGIDASLCIAFGDNMNDVELLEAAGHPFMMGNANPDLIARLPSVPRIGNNFEAGVAHHLHKLFALDNEIVPQALQAGR